MSRAFSLQRARDVRVTSARCRHSMRGRHTRPLRSIAEVLTMSVSRACVVLLMLMGLSSTAARAQQSRQQDRRQPACGAAIPSNVEARMLASEMVGLLQRSETFRSQCERIAAAPRLRVTLDLVSTIPGSGRAQTTFRRFGSGALFAEVEVLFGENYRELLAHEFEHVIEQIEGVNLRRETAEGRAWEIASGTFETRRAHLVGLQVLREAEPTSAHAVAPATR
jgi:hypothetical protein